MFSSLTNEAAAIILKFSMIFMKSILQALFLFSFIFSACKPNNQDEKNPPVIVKLPPIGAINTANENSPGSKSSFDLKSPDQSWKLPKKLVEVSGNTWVDKSHLILIDDNYSSLFLVSIDDKKVELEKTIDFGNKEDKLDIEDVAIVDNIVYALSSHGILYKITDWNNKHTTEKITTFLSGKNDTEGLSYDPVTKSLLIACKNESGLKDEKKSTKAVYRFNMDSKKLEEKPFLIIREDDFKKVTEDKIEFNPSAIAVHPETHEIYLLSTQDTKGMAIYDRDGKLISFQSIDKDLMLQPEGICFSPEGKLYISSEGKKGDAANLFAFNSK
jgi:hypothetical protein